MSPHDTFVQPATVQPDKEQNPHNRCDSTKHQQTAKNSGCPQRLNFFSLSVASFINSTISPTIAMAYKNSTAAMDYDLSEPGIRSLSKPKEKDPHKDVWIVLAALCVLLMAIVANLGYLWLRDRRPRRRVDAAERGQSNIQIESRYQRNLREAFEAEIAANRAARSYPMDDIPPTANRQYRYPSFDESSVPAPAHVRGMTNPLVGSTSQHMPPPSQHATRGTHQSQSHGEPASSVPARSIKPADRLRAKMKRGGRD
ncbi:hypothetical protein AK830_g5785 [Neonectria ditissima]|uniref:Uncharacterized protein n=1 Tax=Neonectria ditissima TaxID=78410 RepID=A0A0P7B460_9HYPO|nr:hypothetical protein AK830_g5785 [Neonectria ditissima]